ncbi:MAG: hypothetical protein U5R48_01995 [Gammaproteobacteria bacterium]|nr:hypothetical protein [Gammaproteobacteria bacterium]
MQAAEDIFERTTCKTCHEVDRIDDPERDSPWQVQPVRLAQVWMPKAWFSHSAHETEECARCHGAEHSTTAADVLMPEVESCRDCHGGGDAREQAGLHLRRLPCLPSAVAGPDEAGRPGSQAGGRSVPISR